MFLLFLSLAALWVGPILLLWAERYPKAIKLIDRLVIASILFLLLFHVIPESFEHAGLIAIAAILVGALWPVVYQKISHSNSCQLQRSLLSLASVGVITHTLFDGAAIASNSYLASAVILHRLPEGLGIWRIAESTFSKYWGVGALLIMSLSTTLGYFAGNTYLPLLPDNFTGLFEGLMAGVLLHVVFHSTHVQYAKKI